jgi:hypothetical protein
MPGLDWPVSQQPPAPFLTFPAVESSGASEKEKKKQAFRSLLVGDGHALNDVPGLHACPHVRATPPSCSTTHPPHKA